MNFYKKAAVLVFSFAALIGFGVGTYYAMHSALFRIETIEVLNVNETSPLNSQAIIQLASVPLGRMSLFSLDLKGVERRLLANEWIQEVQLRKKLLHTLSVRIVFREPKAYIQTSKGSLTFVDSQGNRFGSVNMFNTWDLPLLSGFDAHASDQMKDAIKLLSKWENSQVSRLSELSSVIWDSERGFRTLITYPLNDNLSPSSFNLTTQARAIIDLGQDVDASLDSRLERLSEVIRYLKTKSIAVRQISVDAGKKVVVKTIHGF